MPKSCLKSSKRRKRIQTYGKGLIKNLKMRFLWRMVQKTKGKFYIAIQRKILHYYTCTKNIITQNITYALLRNLNLNFQRLIHNI